MKNNPTIIENFLPILNNNFDKIKEDIKPPASKLAKIIPVVPSFTSFFRATSGKKGRIAKPAN